MPDDPLAACAAPALRLPRVLRLAAGRGSRHQRADMRAALAFLLSGPTSLRARLWLLERLYAIQGDVPCAHTQREILAVVREILTTPTDRAGVVVEAGCFKGGSTAKLSLAASLTG